MALHLHDRNVAHQIAERIRYLIARQDNGDVTAAARRLERPIADVYFPERLIASGDDPAALDFLATVVRRYEADAVWLITGRSARNASAVTSEARGIIVDVLAEFGEHLLDQVRSERDVPARISRPAPAPSPSRDSPYPRTPSPP
jgi:hypothetical protein